MLYIDLCMIYSKAVPVTKISWGQLAVLWQDKDKTPLFLNILLKLWSWNVL